MSERTIGDIAQDNVTNNITYDEQPQEIPKRETGFSFDFLKAETGQGSVSDYLDHPLNFNGSQGMARMIRGLTGLLGNLDLAIVDVVIGAFDVVKTTKNSKGAVSDGQFHVSSRDAGVS